MKRLVFFLPLAIAAIIGGFAIWGLSGDRDPSRIPSVLISQPVPAFDLPPVAGIDTPGLSQADLKGAGEIVLVNAFASWCGPCRAEHPILTRMAEGQGIKVVGLNYKDKPADAAAWLDELGNPYVRIGSDETGRAGIEWGLSGVPETFIVGADGTILYREAGPVVGDGLKRLQRALDAAKSAE
ncbi:DsbE family thiol:disulfide interchange protein [Litoreibacter roseus]|uniref:Thioredoxin domain-containing protein n=1 Tax=Litoreibacter roseus TaxID=2601869 RepID=A0A6N6JFB6_9RHOB|nr:DsbE family thiol:disulfide interchange protein [Litoreibacter roseus]GFE63978.1 hypothetical protein KIN_10520 [Litoreibacter roseus]